MKKVIYLLKPYGKVARSLAVLLASWVLVFYVSVCFGAPALTHWRETGSFSALVVILAVLPTVAVLGAESKSFAQVYLDTDVTADTEPIAHLLFRDRSFKVEFREYFISLQMFVWSVGFIQPWVYHYH